MEFKTEIPEKDGLFLRFLYRTLLGRCFLKLLSARFISKAAGRFLDSRASKFLIKGFVKKNNISSEEYVLDGFNCFNDCFARSLKDGAREFDYAPEALCSPCDGRLSVYKITDGLIMPIKQGRYTVEELLQDKTLAERYDDGIALVFRLCVDNYHRYCYIDNARKGENVFVSGKLHTVRPVALEASKVFCENCREYTVMKTENFGEVTQIEVGALLVGKIKNHHGGGRVCKGDEKGTFLYGGSTIIVLIENGRVDLPNELFDATVNGEEILVKMGEKLGEKIKTKESV